MKHPKLLTLLFCATLLLLVAACQSRENIGDPSSSSPTTTSRTGSDEEDSALPENEPEDSAPSSSAETEVEPALVAALDALKKGDMAAAAPTLDYNKLIDRQEGDTTSDMLQRRVLSFLDYEIVSASQSDDIGVVNAVIRNVDMQVVLTQYYEKARTMSYDNALSESPLDDTALNKKLEAEFDKLMLAGAANMAEKELDVVLKKDGDNWIVQQDKNFRDAVMGGYVSASASLGETGGQ